MKPTETAAAPRPVSAEHVELKRVLGLWDATCVVVGAIIGVGIFFNPRDVANVDRQRVRRACWRWTLGGVVALLGAFTFAELGRLRPLAGGQYHILRDAYGRAPAFLFVFCNLTAVQARRRGDHRASCARSIWAWRSSAPTLGHVGADVWRRVFTWALVGLNVVGVRSGAGSRTRP